MKGKIEKGDYGYIPYRKKTFLIRGVIFILIGIAIFIVGLFLNKMDTKNIFTVMAILMSLPFAKNAVEFIVLFPFHSPAKEAYEQVKKLDLEGMKIYSDLVITSADKIMNLDFLIEGQGTVIGLMGKDGQDVRYVDDYLTKGIRNWGASYNVKILGDNHTFFNALENIKPHDCTEIEQKHVTSYIKSLIV